MPRQKYCLRKVIMPVKKQPVKKNTVKKSISAVKKTTAALKTASTVESVKKPTLQDFLIEVQKKAYVLYEERLKSGIPEDEIADWFAAEKEIKEKYHL